MAHEIAKLNARHQNIIKLLLLGTYTQRQVASLCGFDPNSIGYIINSPVFQAELARRRATLSEQENAEICNNISLAKEQIGNAALGAVKKLDELCHESPDQNIQLRAAESILKQAFGRDTPNGPQIGQVIVLDGGNLDFLRRVREESGLNHEPKFIDSVELGTGGVADAKAFTTNVDREPAASSAA